MCTCIQSLYFVSLIYWFNSLKINCYAWNISVLMCCIIIILWINSYLFQEVKFIRENIHCIKREILLAHSFKTICLPQKK